MDLKSKSITKLVIRLVGVSFGLAIALFLFSAVASGHSYHSQQPAHAAVAQVAQHHDDGGNQLQRRESPQPSTTTNRNNNNRNYLLRWL